MNRPVKAYFALIFICIIWGTTYMAIRVAVGAYPPFLMAGTRQLLAGLIIMIPAYLYQKKADLSKSMVLHNMLVGFLMLTLGNGLVSWGEKYIPSGISALICSLMPISAVMINVFSGRAEKLNWLVITGMLLGCGGVALIFKNDMKSLSNTQYLGGIIATLVAATAWAWGSVTNKQRTNQVNPVFNSGMQLFWGGVFMLVISPFADNYTHVDYFNTKAFLAFLYLVIFGSVLAFTAYMYALKELPVGLASIYAYINPLVAIFVGYWILNEPLTWMTGFAFVCILFGVYLVNRGYRNKTVTRQ